MKVLVLAELGIEFGVLSLMANECNRMRLESWRSYQIVSLPEVGIYLGLMFLCPKTRTSFIPEGIRLVDLVFLFCAFCDVTFLFCHWVLVKC